MASPITDLSNLCVHTITTKPWSLEEAIREYTQAGVSGITVWRQALEPYGAQEAGRMLRDSDLSVVSLCRGGFFPATTAEKRQEGIDDNRRAIEEAVAIGAPLIVLVCGADPGQTLAESRRQIADGITAVLPDCEAAGVKLAIEPLHPMYADTRSAINTMAQANEMVEALGHPLLGVAVDVYHLWWDPNLESEIQRAGDRIFAFHICDWLSPTRDLLLDRGLMGDGCINIREIRGWVEAAGFKGFTEVEIFSTEWWGRDQKEFLDKIIEAYRSCS